MERTKIGIYYHCFCINDYEDRFLRTYEKIKRSGLLKQIEGIKLVCVGRPTQQIIDLPKIETILCRSNCIDEAVTLNYIYHTNTYDKFLYLHSKGVTKLGNQNVSSWVNYMEYFCVEKYQDRLIELQQYDVTGVNIQYHYEFTTSLLYSGNFWWTTGQHIKTLSPCDERDRRLAELWICTNPQGKYNCIHSSELDHYHSDYVRESYTKELPII
jgi:hypothetical protein